MDWYSMSAADAVGKLSSSVDRGLSSREAETVSYTHLRAHET